ncbi:hypothetical protein VPDG_00149 [Vibrio phage henriette 12B8]|uniref:hypothetical protein n=1 Tax=Vibrio phage henriette 12B8 TaxID=573174 RepID=UPI0002C1559B|nr:hypothetical protein VPDG_00149 [Vibrio phage henriette 12B8]AGG58310.1 hypothetical protein VPDG_00149 [Vibrio phage henriette 12B8]
MKKLILDKHTINVMNEQGCATKDGTQYTNKHGQSYEGDLFFIFDKKMSANPSRMDYIYSLNIVFVCANGNKTKIHHRMNNSDLMVLYNYVSSRSDESTLRTATNVINELNSHYKQFETTIK